MTSIACTVRGFRSSDIKALPDEQSLGSQSGHVPKGEPRGLTGHPIIFNAFINHLEGDAQRPLPKPADYTRQAEWWLMKRGGQRRGEMRVTGLMQTECVCSGRALCRGARGAADRCGGRTPYPGKQSRERVTEQCQQSSQERVLRSEQASSPT